MVDGFWFLAGLGYSSKEHGPSLGDRRVAGKKLEEQLKGEKEARAHASETGHVDFGEY